MGPQRKDVRHDFFGGHLLFGLQEFEAVPDIVEVHVDVLIIQELHNLVGGHGQDGSQVLEYNPDLLVGRFELGRRQPVDTGTAHDDYAVVDLHYERPDIFVGHVQILPQVVDDLITSC